MCRVYLYILDYEEGVENMWIYDGDTHTEYVLLKKKVPVKGIGEEMWGLLDCVNR